MLKYTINCLVCDWDTAAFCTVGFICYTIMFQVTKAEIAYWKVENPEHFSFSSFPVFIEVNMMDKESIQQFFNGIPILEYPGLLKVRCR